MNKTTLNSQKEKHSLLSLRRATFVGLAAHRLRNISIHALLAESDTSQPHCAGSFAISIHALLAESDPIISSATSCRWLFLSTLSLRRATCAPVAAIGHRLRISIHALLAESDVLRYLLAALATEFLSTLSLRRATHDRVALIPHQQDFYPRSPCGERHDGRNAISPVICISIHALLAESDFCPGNGQGVGPDFYPRSPCGERRWYKLDGKRQLIISIHALLAESDALESWPDSEMRKISIHALLAESDVTVLGIQHKVGISIHALLAESDLTV